MILSQMMSLLLTCSSPTSDVVVFVAASWCLGFWVVIDPYEASCWRRLVGAFCLAITVLFVLFSYNQCLISDE
jgi:hypothetical protein